MKHSILFSLLLAFWAVSGCTLFVEVKDPPTNNANNAICGDGRINGAEDCEGSNLGGKTCTSLQLGSGTLACDEASCTFDTSGCESASFCGNDVRDGTEECDNNDFDGDTCADHGFTGGTLTCDAECKINTGACTGSGECGDNVASDSEACDGTDLKGSSCVALGYTGGTLRCATDCSGFITTGCTGPVCGNDVRETGEDCDGTDLHGETCESQAMGTGMLMCKTDCQFDFTGCTTEYCGNGNIDTGEDCDGTNIGSTSCADLGYDGGTLWCMATDCRFDTTSCTGSVCGDGRISEDEECDGADHHATICQDWGFYDGMLNCGGDCRFDFSGCTNNPLWTGPTLVDAGGVHSCAIIGSTEVLCWGSDQHGQLGVQSGQMYQPVPVKLSYNANWLFASHLSAGGMHTCAVGAGAGYGGKVLCWGNGTFGQLGNGSTLGSPLPTPTTGTSNISKVAAGFEHTCALASDSKVYCWGSNTQGQLGIGFAMGTSKNQPTMINSLNNIIEISAGFNHTCAIQQIDAVTNRLWCWGENAAGQLGVNNYSSSDIPVQVGTFNPRAVSCGQAHTCALNDANIVHCWGDNTYGQLGRSGSGSNIPIVVMKSGSAFAASLLTAGDNHTCAYSLSGAMGDTFCWGKNNRGQLGLGDMNQRNSPTMVTRLLSTTQLSGGGDQTCMIGQRVRENDCSDAFDNDGDGVTDCDDNDCLYDAACNITGIENTALLCGDSMDNDGDGKHDCNDPDCFSFSFCMTTENCSDGTDNDMDGFLDCADPICHNDPMCMVIPTRVNCWGGNWYGQLGNATTVDQYWPIIVSGQY